MDTIENNKLIAEFIGLKKVNHVRDEEGEYYDFELGNNLTLILEEEIEIESNRGWGLVSKDYVFSRDLIFHSDWNWLMEVVEKIESLGFEFFIVESRCKIAHNTDKSIEVVLNLEQVFSKIKTTYNACVEFIKWYNAQQK